jgi:ABC-2 type transport system permease protein
MTVTAQNDPERRSRRGEFWRRSYAMTVKEFIQLKRDRVSFAMIIMIPLVQLLLFGYAINTNPRHLPTAVLLQENSDVGRSILRALENTQYFKVTHVVRTEREFDRLLANGSVLFAIEIPANFERDLRRGDRPAILVASDATDPVASGSAIAALNGVLQTALRYDHGIPETVLPPFEFRTHARYNPAAETSLNIVPGLVGTILTMTMLIFTALSVTREIERGTMESLLSMPIGFIQASLILSNGILLFGVPLLGSLSLLAALSTLFITANLAIGYTFSTLAQNQLQAMQMSLMFFLPNILLSGFMFPFAGMPVWAQWIGEALPLTHYLRIVRSIMLKGAAFPDLYYDTAMLAGLMLFAMAVAVTRFRRTLD